MDYEFFGTIAAIIIASVAVAAFLLNIKNEMREDMREIREDIREIRKSVESLSERVARIEGLFIGPRDLPTHPENND